MKIHWNQLSTKQGAIWLVIGIAGLIQSWGHISVQDLVYLGASVAGGVADIALSTETHYAWLGVGGTVSVRVTQGV